jgi:chromate transporter
MTQERLPTLTEATWLWLRIGCLSFGGPAAQIALMHKLIVEERNWIGEARFLNALNYCMLLPGPEAQQLATYIGWLMHGVRGGLIAGILFILPGALVIMGLSVAYLLYTELPGFQALFFGLKCAVLAIVLEAMTRIAGRTLDSNWKVAIAILAFGALFLFNLPFPLVVLGGAVLGVALGAQSPGKGVETAGAPGLIDGALSRGELHHARPAAGTTMVAALLCAVAWAAPVALVFALTADGSVWRDIAIFFSQAAVVTFGGAYAVLPYVGQTAVETYGWLNAKEMMHGLALAETTPGPLILVLQYVGFLAAARQGGIDPILGGVLGGALATWVTFAPSFLWIFTGAPYAEAIQRIAALRAALSGVTAAVAGVILNLALWFGLHVLFAKVDRVTAGPVATWLPDPSTIDFAALGLSALAAILLIRFKFGVIPVLILCAAVGLAIEFTPLWIAAAAR